MEKTEEKAGPREILRKLQENKSSLHIARIPVKTKEEFIKLANEEFCSDFGMTLKFLIDDVPHQDTRMLVTAIDHIEERVSVLESKQSEPVDSVSNKRKRLDGTGGEKDE